MKVRKEKESKLREKPTRLPDIYQDDIENIFSKYVKEASELTSESAKSKRFLLLLKDSYGEQPGFIKDFLHGDEKYVKVKQDDLFLRGKIDTLYGNLVIEFESDLDNKLPEAKDQLKKYITCLWSKIEDRNRSYLGIATDGLDFQVYSPGIKKSATEIISPKDIILTPIDKVDFKILPPYDAYFWLDRYFFRKCILSPKTEEFERDFGPDSPACHYSLTALGNTWPHVKKRSDIKVIYENWEKYLRVTYGSTIASEELFLKHTYLATLAKLMVWMRLTGATTPPPSEELLSILLGDFFEKKGFVNFLEEDFFSWVGREYARDTGLDVSRKLIHQLAKYNLNELSEDILKGLYQELVDPETRHDLGEYYTPDWLAQRMVEKTLEDNPRASVLDPACGSGTFLYMVVRYKKDKLGDSRQTLEHILENTAGIEIHPLAVIISKTNYLLALGELLKKRKGPVNIPIYMADSIRPQESALLTEYELYIDGKHLLVPKVLFHDSHIYDEAIELAKKFSRDFAGKEIEEETFENVIKRHSQRIASRKGLISAIFPLAKVMKEFIEEGRDTIWAFILKNIFKPVFLKEKFDVIVGNPPWLSFRYVEKGEYQSFLKILITKRYFLLSGKAELITHMELATLFFLRSADLYLRKEGTIGFVLPRSIFTADQHDVFRRSVFPFPLALKGAWDLERVEPLFNVPACVFFARKGGKTGDSLPCEVISGQLGKKNASLEEAEKKLKVSQGRLFVKSMGKRSFLTGEEVGTGLVPVHGRPQGPSLRKIGPSHYKPYFKEGATIVPRGFWFVEIVPSKLGFDPERPYVQTASTVEKTAKPEYKGIKFEGNVEREFLYATLLSTDVVPFGHLNFRLVVLPIRPSGRGYEILKIDKARDKGFLNLAKWLDRAEKEWKERRGEKAGKMTIYQRLDHIRGITAQDRLARYKVLYPMSATYLCGCVVENKGFTRKIEDQKVKIEGIVVDYVNFYYDTDDRAESYYLASISNSQTIDKFIKPMQARGQWGPRHICKKLWELPIPKFDPKNRDHLALAGLGERCTEKVEKLLPSLKDYKGIGHIRRIIKEGLKEELAEIDGITRRVLGL